MIPVWFVNGKLILYKKNGSTVFTEAFIHYY